MKRRHGRNGRNGSNNKLTWEIKIPVKKKYCFNLPENGKSIAVPA